MPDCFPAVVVTADVLNADSRRAENGEGRGDLRGTHDRYPAHRDSSSAQADGGAGDEIGSRQRHGYTLSLDTTVRADRAECWRSLVHRERLDTAGSPSGCNADVLNADSRRAENGESRGDLRGTHDHYPAHRDSSSAQADGGAGDEIGSRQSHGYIVSAGHRYSG